MSANFDDNDCVGGQAKRQKRWLW